MKNIIIKRINADETRGLRKKLLRPTQPNEKLFYYGDDFEDTYHAGAFDDNLLVGIASVCRENKSQSTGSPVFINNKENNYCKN